MGEVFDVTDKLKQKPGNNLEREWIVQIHVKVTWQFLYKAIYCFFTKKELGIRHTFDHDPLRRG